MIRLLPLLLILTLAGAGCSLFRADDAPTIGDLSRRPVRLEDVPIDSGEQQARQDERQSKCVHGCDLGLRRDVGDPGGRCD